MNHMPTRLSPQRLTCALPATLKKDISLRSFVCVCSPCRPLPPQPNLVTRSKGLAGSLLSQPKRLLGAFQPILKQAAHVFWTVEDVAVEGARHAFRLAKKAARPVLVGEWQTHRVRGKPRR